MARRSPTNARYQKHTTPKGQTRKSAAAAKPARKEGTGASEKAKAKRTAPAQPGSKYYEPDTPEYKLWRRVWWSCLGVGIVFVSASFALQYYFKDLDPSRLVSNICVVVAWASIILGFFIDYRMLRPMRAGTYVSRSQARAAKAGHADEAAQKTSAESAETKGRDTAEEDSADAGSRAGADDEDEDD